MKIVKVMVNRKFFLGNFETLDMAAEAELSENDNPLATWELIRDNIEMEYIAMQSKTRKAPTPACDKAVAEQQKTESPFKRVETKSVALKPENKCPGCGAWKDSRYPQCYVCH